MSHFEYVMMLASFVIAFGVARLLGGWARQYALRKQTPSYLLQVAVSALLLVAMLQNACAVWVVLGGILDFIYMDSLSSNLPFGAMFAFRSGG